ncbi:hypothetical protein MMC31_003979 [Peltigera leucophlebia]|nr:hypothetical protein [Peltigera leucophlebia]
MLPHLTSTSLMLLTPLLTFWCQQGSAETLTPLSIVSLLPTSSFVTAIRQKTTETQPAEALLASSSSLPTLPSAFTPDPSSSPLALFPPSLPPSFNGDDKAKAKADEAVLAEESPTSTQEISLLPRSGLRPRPAGIFAQCSIWYSAAYWFIRLEQIKEWHVPDDVIEGNLRAELRHHCSAAVTGEHFFPIEEDGRGALFRAFVPLFIPERCVERAIVASGGPEISCDSRRPPPPWKSSPASPWIPIRDGPVGSVVNNVPSVSTPTVSQTAAVNPS